ncbi:protein SMAX1-LIKE 6-like [Cynara cardunculus var. scolymus]|uniref:Double Clp-N motif-containing protein n=1 Tax=Cynara cardunculus var. scolymus TaxID=59895 RepID=A0A103Y704_CYNCS|nr:protein SMAX1-LIKE 6-like [Cynara cardunculus var. scolymus]XP_024974977.1 protein SMAX1-LIKE 6-like [Cynara cardunculus var. scolymus]KVI03681.1 Double Clp-N motif-containing protein [Cynara cardunculus var. scolymus]
MPTPVSSARQCLTDEAARALDDAVAVARRRSHSQTTSLHAVSALLSLPTSTLRDACARARSSAYSPRLQFRALELCVSVSLDRLPSSKSKTPDDEPPVSNSLMAAIKRSQANQRRHPETFHLYQMHQQLNSSQSSLSCVKVELKHFILSILDDPIVSRVFGDAGFRSTDIKVAVLHPPPVSGFQKSMRFPPLFLCSLPDTNTNLSGFNFPFAVDQGEEDFKRIGQILAKKSSKNPLLIGVSADSVLAGFTDALKIGKNGFLPTEIEGLNVITIDKEICEFLVGNLSEDMMDLKLKEVRDKVESCTGCGVIVNFGELKLFVDGGSTGSVEHLVSQLSSLVQLCGGKLWLIGAVGSYETYMKILAKFPGLEKEWDLNLLPITSSKLNTNGSHLKSSLMGSFVPFGGFFPVPTELENSSSNTDQSKTRCSLCNEKYEHEVSVALKRGRTVSVADQQSMGLTSWLQVPESDTSKGSNVLEAKDHGGVFNALVAGLQRKWNDICHRLHHNQQNNPQITAGVPFPRHFPADPKRVEISSKDSNQEGFRNLSPSDQRDYQKTQHIQLTVTSEAENSLPQKPPVDFFAATKLASTTSSPTTSITTDLGLGTIYVSPDLEPRPHDHKARIQNFCGSASAEVDEMSTKFYEKDYKALYRALADKVGDQDGSIRAISQTISRCRTGNGIRHGSSHRRDIWLMFSGSDRVGKKKISTALAEVVFGSRESLIAIDLNFENQIRHPSSIFDRQSVNFCDLSFRGKTITDFIAEELSKKPRLLILLEHIDKADSVTQDSLSRAIRTGKLSDSRGRETRITDAIFVTTSSSSKEADLLSYSEERVLNARAFQMRILVESTIEPRSSSILLLPTQSTSRNPVISSKRKLIELGDFEIMVPAVKKSKSCFDLNLPVEETEESENSENGSVSETKEVWLEEFSDQVDEKVVFDPFDFDSNAETILKDIGICFQKSFGSNHTLEIENEVMIQILASRWLSDRKDAIRDWIDSILFTGFMESKQKLRVEADIENGSSSMVKLVAVEGVNVEDDGSCVYLPSRIMVK